MRSQVTYRSEVPAPNQSDIGSAFYAVDHAVGLYVDERQVVWDDTRTVVTELDEPIALADPLDIGGGVYAVSGALGRFIKEYVLAPSDAETQLTVQMDGASTCGFVGLYTTPNISIEDWQVDGAGGCWFEAPDNPAFRCDGVGGAWFLPTRRGFLQMDGAGGAAFGAVGLGVAGLQMDGAGSCVFGVASAPSTAQGTFQCDGVGGMEIVLTLDLGFISDDGTPGGGNRRWNYAF